MLKSLALGIILPVIAAVPGGCLDAVLKKAQGDVRVRAQGEEDFEPAAAGAPLLLGDEIQTAGKSSAHIVFLNGDTVLLKENSRLALTGTKKDVELSIPLGEFLIGLKRTLRGGESFRVKTPAAVAAVRGTLFWGLAAANKDTTYASFGHSVEITAEGKTIELKAGQTLKIPFGKAPEDPSPSTFKPSYLATFALGHSLEGLNKLVDLPKAK